MWKGLEHILYNNPFNTDMAYIYPIATIHIQEDENEQKKLKYICGENFNISYEEIFLAQIIFKKMENEN
jgi:hypothetical protein